MRQTPSLNHEAGGKDAADEPGHAQFAIAHCTRDRNQHERQRRNEIDLPEIIKFDPPAPEKSVQSLILFSLSNLPLIESLDPRMIVCLLRPRFLPNKVTPHGVGLAVDV